MKGLTFIEILVVGYWYLLDEWSYDLYVYYVEQVGVQPRYAFKKVFNKL